MGLEDLGNKPEAWIAEEGDQIKGTIVNLGELPSEYGSGSYPTVEFKEDGIGKLWIWHAFDTVAKNELARQSPAVGDRFGAAYLGVKKTKPGSKYDSFKDWHVVIEKATGPVNAPDWDGVGEDAKAEGVESFAQGSPPPFPDDDELGQEEPF